MSTVFTPNIADEITRWLPTNASEPIFVLTDEPCKTYCLDKLLINRRLQSGKIFVFEAGDQNKTLETATKIWQFLSENGATRHSLLINLGGGVVTDIGGFVAATFKRGIDFVNIPTTLLGTIDAATGGKTGVNLNGLKNEIGLFANAKAVLIDTDFFRTLDHTQLLSGFAEMLKHALIDSDELLNDTFKFDLETVNLDELQRLLQRNIDVKKRIVEADPHEIGLRKALNFGHTFGHAFETLSFDTETPLPHGFAVMWGIVCELYLSLAKFDFPKETLLKMLYFAKENYGNFLFSCKHYDRIFELMKHDKKNEAATINFTLLSGVGEPKIDQTATKDEIFEALDFVN